LGADPPCWPDSTRRLSELRITIEYRSTSALRRAFGISRLNLDIVDYPGEWLIDLPLLDKSYEAWSAEALAQAGKGHLTAHAKPWIEFLAGVDPYARKDEQAALKGAPLYADYLKAARHAHHQLH
jgi:predicted YcjX-like family ATPase